MIICVEDDTAIRELMLYTLRASGFEAEGFANGADFWKGIQEQLPELILLDVMLPDEDGISILKKLRASPVTAEIPVIIASAKGTEYDKVIGLDLGADDYLAKTFGMMEMISRVKAVLRRTRPEKKSTCSLGTIALDEGSRRVTVNGQEVVLTLKEYELLRLFLHSPGKVFTREELLNAVWDNSYLGETRTVDVHIATLRTKLGDAGKMIQTVRGVGYRMEERP